MKNSSKARVMPIKPIAMAVLLLAGSIGAVLAQTPGKGNAAMGVPEISATSPAAQDPGVNPNAAGTVPGRNRSGPVAESVKRGGEHGGSKNLSANTHPLAAAKANRQLRQRQRTEESLQRQIGGPEQAQQRSGSSSGR